MKYQQMDLFKSHRTTTGTDGKMIMDIYLKIKQYWSNKWMNSTLEDINKILNKETVKFKKKKYKKFVYKIGKILKQDIKKNKQMAMKIIGDLGYLKYIQDGGHPVSIYDFVDVLNPVFKASAMSRFYTYKNQNIKAEVTA